MKPKIHSIPLKDNLYLYTINVSRYRYGFTLATADDDILGAAFVEHKPEGYNKWVLKFIHTQPQHRRKGYGSILLDATCDRLFDMRKYPILLHLDLPGFSDTDFGELIQLDPVKFRQEFQLAEDELRAWFGRHGFHGERMMARWPK